MDNSYTPQNNNNRSIYFVVGIIVVLVIVVGIIVKLSHSANDSSVAGSNTNQITQAEAAPQATEALNKVYNFPITDASGKEVGKFTYELVSADLRNTILVKGTPATAATGKTFLIVNLKITNNNDKDITSMSTRDYIRASVDGKKNTDPSKEWLAPVIHNDPVEVLAISTKYTNLGFSINTSDANKAVLQVGEVAGKKDYINLHFNNIK